MAMILKYLGYDMKLMHILFHLNGFTAAFDFNSFLLNFPVYGKAAVASQALLVKSIIIPWQTLGSFPFDQTDFSPSPTPNLL